MRPLEFGWFVPTSGDSEAFGDPSATIDVSDDHLRRVTQAAEKAGFEYLLTPVGRQCWEAYILGAFLAAFFEEQAPMVQSDDSADVNRAQDHARRRGTRTVSSKYL